MKKFIVLMAIVAMLGSTQAELFVNGDFEAGPWSGGGSGSGAAFGWTGMAPSYLSSGGSDGGAWMDLDTSKYVAGSWGWGWSGIWQDVPASGGQEMTLSGQAMNLNGENTLRAFVAFNDPCSLRTDFSGDGISEALGNLDPDTKVAKAQMSADRYQISWATGASWAAFEDIFTVPTMTDGTTVAAMAITISHEDGSGVIGVDELSLIPEPMTIGLLGLGALFLRRRKA